MPIRILRLTCPFVRILVLSLLSLIFLPGNTLGSDSRPKRVLVLHSYHHGLAWTDDVMAGIEEVLSSPEGEIQLHIEYLDTKRNPDNQYFFHIYDEVLQHKLTRSSFDLVLLSDNDALKFALRHRNDLFAGVPIVFCGVNNFSPSLIAGVSGVYGVAELPSFRETMEVALKLHPGTDRMVVIGRTDNETGRSNHRKIASLSPEFPARIDIEYWNDLEAAEVEKRLARLPKTALVFLSSALKDGDGRVLSFTEAAARVRAACPVPVYGFWDFFLGKGIVGGKLVSGAGQGRLAAGLALRVLRGEAPEDIPVIRDDANTYMFDYEELSRFDVPLYLLPEATLLNAPSPFYKVTKEQLRAGLGAIAVLFLFILLLVINIHRRRRAEAALRDSEEWLRLALKGARDAMWDWHVPTGKNIINDQWAAMLGYGKEEIEEKIGQWESMIHPEDLPGVHRAHRDCMRGKSPNFAAEFRMRTKSGAWTWILGRGMVVERGPAGEPVRLVGTHADISRAKMAEQALKESLADVERAKEKIDAILKSMVDGLIATDTGHRIVLMNQAAENLLGLPLKEALGRPIAEIFPAGEQPWAGGAIDMDFYDFRKEQMRTVQIRSCVSRTEKGREAGFITILQDVTKTREMDRMKSEFISTAAHELRTPLTSVIGFAELLCGDRDLAPSEQKEYLGIIREKARVLEERVDDLLDLSRIESGGLIPLDPVPCEMKSILEAAVSPYRRISERHSFDLSLPGEEVQLVADRGKLDQVLENLLGNAVKYSPEGGLVRVEGMLEEDFFRISVADEGIGMTEEQVGRMFDKFYRVDSSNTAVGGLGLGMSIARNIVEAHGGSMRAESEEGRGTKVIFTLPLTEVESVEALG